MIFCPVNIICFAIPIPTVLDNLCVPPKPGVIPRPTSGCPKIALSEHILISQLKDISHPPPSAKPFTAAITGISKVSIFLKTSFPFLENSSASFFDKVDISDISAPATKDFSPSPVIIKALILDVSIESNACDNSSRTWLFKAFNALGRDIVINEISSSSVYFMYSKQLMEIRKETNIIWTIFDFIFM